MRYRSPLTNPSTSSVRLRAICVTHSPFALLAIPPISTPRVDSSMKKRMTNRWSPLGLHTSIVKKSLATICCQCLSRNSFQVCLTAAFWGRFDAMPFQDAGDRVVRQKVTQIGKRSLNPPVTPGSILFGHPDNQVCDFLGRSPSSRGSKRTAIIFLREQFSVPRQQSLGSDDAGHLRQ